MLNSTEVPLVNPPIVIDHYPDAGQRDVFLNGNITVTFNQNMDSSTITGLTFLVVKTGTITPVNGTVSFSSATRTATFVPYDFLAAEETYLGIIVGNQDPHALVSQGVKNTHGEAMQGNYSWQFYTGSNVTSNPDIAALPSGVTGYESPQVPNPTGVIRNGQLEIEWTDPTNYESNLPVTSQVVIQFNDNLAVELDSALGQMTLGNDYIDSVSGVLLYAISVANESVLGDPYVSHNQWQYITEWDTFAKRVTLSSHPETQAADGYYNAEGVWASGNLLTGVMEENNRYTVTVKKSLIGMTTGPLYVPDENKDGQGNYVFFFTTQYDPMYTTAIKVRLNLGNFVHRIPDDTINLFIHENSIIAQKLYPLGIIDPGNVPDYVEMYVLCKTKLDVMNATAMDWAGAGGRKHLADLDIEHNTLARDIDLLLKPKRDELVACIEAMLPLVTNGGCPTTADWAVIGQYQQRRPIKNSSWRRLPTLNPDGVQRPGTAGSHSYRPRDFFSTKDGRWGKFSF